MLQQGKVRGCQDPQLPTVCPRVLKDRLICTSSCPQEHRPSSLVTGKGEQKGMGRVLQAVESNCS